MSQTCCGVNCKRLLPTVLVVFVFIFISDILIHGVGLANAYKESQSLWRMEDEMKRFMVFLWLGQLVIAATATVLFAKGYEGKGLMEGLRFGLLIGLFGTGYTLIQYAVSPLPSCIVWTWIGAGIAQAMGAGVIMALVYRKA